MNRKLFLGNNFRTPIRNDKQRPYYGVLILGGIIGIMGISEIYGRLAIEVDGRVLSATTECQEPQHNRCASVYVIESKSGTKQTYVAGPTDQSLRRYIPAGSHLQKQKWELSYQIDGKETEDFPIGFYLGILALSLSSFVWWLYLHMKSHVTDH